MYTVHSYILVVVEVVVYFIAVVVGSVVVVVLVVVLFIIVVSICAINTFENYVVAVNKKAKHETGTCVQLLG